ncbi:MAG: sensor histidine kinase N-terminal domain-containing protein [Burkholderiales bacterium]
MRHLTLTALHSLSLRRTLLLVLFPGLLLGIGAELWATWRTAVDAANSAYDRSLLGAIKSMDANISTESGGLGVELPYRMLEFFELTASGRVYYRVATEDGLVEIGSPDLPAPVRPLVTGQPQFSDARYGDEAVRVGSYARLLDRPLAGRAVAQRIVIQVAETLESRQAFTRTLLLQAVARDLALVLAATTLLVLVVGWALRPLARLRGEVRRRLASDQTPISAVGIPSDVRPLVEAINHHVERNRQQVEARRRFIDDASHQLRTPLTTLATQVGFALRESDPAQQRAALKAIQVQLDEAVRQTNQMLLLARTDTVPIEPERVDLVPFAHEMARRWWSEARGRGIDFGLDAVPGSVVVRGIPALLTEALSNLLHNAIRYVPRDGKVTVHVTELQGMARLTVTDTGPGIPPDEMGRAGERFFRASNVSQPGSGLGLAIVRSIAERHGGQLELRPAEPGPGLDVSIVLPLDRADPKVPG